MASQTYNLNTWVAKRIIGDNSTATATNALLHNGSGRGNTATGDTWIFYDDASAANTPWGFKHDQPNDKISFYGAGTNTSWLGLGTGNFYISGKAGIGYDPGTSGNTYSLYVNGTTYLNNATTLNGVLTLKGSQYYYNSTCGINANNSDIIGLNCLQFNDAADTFREGIMFPNSTAYDCLAANGGAFYFRCGTDGTPAVNSANANGKVYAANFYGTFNGNATSATTATYLAIRQRLNADANAMNFNPGADGYFRLSAHIMDSTSRSKSAANSPSFDATILNFPWDWGGYNGQIAMMSTATTGRMQIRSASHTDQGEGASPRYTPNYGSWREVVTADKATQMGSGTQPVYINSSGQCVACTTYANASVSNAVYLKDRTNSTASYLNYGAAGLAASAITWLCCWNGYEVRAISKAEMANAVDGAHKWVRLGGDTMTGQLYINLDQDVGLNQNGSLVIGTKASTNIGIDSNEIMARNNGAASTLYINSEGGLVYIGSGGLQVAGTITGSITGNAETASQLYVTGNANTVYLTGVTAYESKNQTQYIYSPCYMSGGYLYAYGFFATANHYYCRYNNTNYGVVYNHGNANISINACGGGLYVGYLNTTLINWLNGKATLDSNGTFQPVKIDIRPGTHGWVMQVGANQWGGTGIANGTGDGSGNGSGNLSIASWQGIIFEDGTNWTTKSGINCRTGVYYGKGFSNTSSILVKENIKSLSEDKARQILSTRPVSFDYKKEFGGMKGQFGLIAEELEEILPELVEQPTDKKGYKHIDYTRIIPFLIKLAQSQQKEIDELKLQINNLI